MNDEIMAQLLRRVAELERRVSQMVVRGKVSEVDAEKQRVKVKYGENLVSGWLPWKPLRSGKAIVWWCPEVGEGVTILSNGDLSLGEVVLGSYHDEFPAPSSDPEVFYMDFGDGSTVEYNRGSAALDVALKGDLTATVEGKTELTATGGAKIIGDVEIDGKLDVTKDITGAGEVSDKKASMSKDRLAFNAHSHPYSWSDPAGAASTNPPTPRQ